MASDELTDDAPLRTRRDDKEGELVHVGRTVLIGRPRAELYAFWRDFTNLTRFMENLESIQPTGENSSVWTIRAPAGQTVDVETEVAEDIANEVIAWRSVDGSVIKTTGRVTFADAPAGRGTVVSLDIAYDPPAGAVGRVVAKLFAAEPNIQARHELKRFKMLMEAGEISTGLSHREKKD